MAKQAKVEQRPAKKAKFANDLPAKKPNGQKAKLAAKAASKAAPKKAAPTPKPTKTPSSKNKGKAKAAPEVESEPEPLPKTFMVVAGSYEKLLYGLEGSVSDDLEFHLKPIFIFPAHVSCIKSVAASPSGGKWLATGSTDEIIKVWDLRRRKEIGGLMHHEGSITHLVFPSKSHLMSCSEDGTLAVFRARDWAVLRTLKGHKGHVNCVAVHPSSKVALSVGKDRTLRMWDLMRGKGCASTKLGKEGELVRWSTDGKMFGVQYASTVDIYNTDMAQVGSLTHSSRIVDIQFCKHPITNTDLLLVGAEDKKLSVYTLKDASNPKLFAVFVGHTKRIKAIQTHAIALPSTSPTPSTTIICTASSDGKVHVYDLASLPDSIEEEGVKEVIEVQPKAEYDTKGTRLTCITIGDGSLPGEVTQGKRKRGKEVDEDEDEDEDDDEGEEAWGGVQGDSDDAEDDDDSEGSDEEEEEEEIEGEVEEEEEEE